MANNNPLEDEDEFQQYLGEYTGLDDDCGEIVSLVRQVRDNSYELEELRLYYDDTDCFTNHAWLLLGRYIAKNTFLERLELSNCNLNDEKMASLFRELTSSSSLQRLDLGDNQFGIDGLRCTLPFIESSSMLSSISFHISNSFDNECFDILVRTLHGKKVAKLSVGWCNIIDISVLETYNLPKLRDVLLNGNNIGREGFIIISNLLQKESTTLRSLSLMETGMGDEEAEMIASSIKHNTTLKRLNLLRNNKITENGRKVFLKLLVDVSSVANTYKSNHALRECLLIGYDRPNEIQSLINNACRMNESNASISEAVGRSKVIQYQLNSQTRKKLCHLQGIEYTSIGNLFADIEPVLLPQILASIGDRHGQSELYTVLIPTAPDLLSYLDRKALIKDTMEKNEAKDNALTAEYERKVAALKTELLLQKSNLTSHNNELRNRLALIESGDRRHMI